MAAVRSAEHCKAACAQQPWHPDAAACQYHSSILPQQQQHCTTAHKRTQLVGGGVELRRGGARPVLARLPQAALVHLQRPWHTMPHSIEAGVCGAGTVPCQSAFGRQPRLPIRGGKTARRRTWPARFAAAPAFRSGAPPCLAQAPLPPRAAPGQSPPPQTRRPRPAAACVAHTGRGAPRRAASRPPRCSWRWPRLQQRAGGRKWCVRSCMQLANYMHLSISTANACRGRLAFPAMCSRQQLAAAGGRTSQQAWIT